MARRIPLVLKTVGLTMNWTEILAVKQFADSLGRASPGGSASTCGTTWPRPARRFGSSCPRTAWRSLRGKTLSFGRRSAKRWRSRSRATSRVAAGWLASTSMRTGSFSCARTTGAPVTTCGPARSSRASTRRCQPFPARLDRCLTPPPSACTCRRTRCGDKSGVRAVLMLTSTEISSQVARVGHEPTENIRTMEDHVQAYDTWTAAGVRDRILVHVDGHLDFDWIADRSPEELLAAGSSAELDRLLTQVSAWNSGWEAPARPGHQRELHLPGDPGRARPRVLLGDAGPAVDPEQAPDDSAGTGERRYADGARPTPAPSEHRTTASH